MLDQGLEAAIARAHGIVLFKTCLFSVLLFGLFAAPRRGVAKCAEKPTVWMNESTAASHLLASRKFVFPAVVPVLAHIRSVTVRVTVSRQGNICGAKAEAGAGEFRRAAEEIVKTSWRFKPFILDRKPVVAEFPVTVNFVLSADRQDVRAPEIAGAGSVPEIPNGFPWMGAKTARV